jgi:hypothetical protein
LRLNWHNTLALLTAPVVIAGCGGRVSVSGVNAVSGLSIQASVSRIDTNRTARYSATLANGEPANVEWSVSGGDPRAGAGTISRDGVYTPPGYLTRDAITVEVSAVVPGSQNNLASDSARLTVTPGFLQPLTPGNLALGSNGTATVSGSMTEVGGSGGIHFTLASDPSGTPSTAGSLSAPHCMRGAVDGANPAYTVCSVTYTAPASVAATDSIYILGSIAAEGSSNPTVSWTRVLLNSAGIGSNPVAHQARLAVPVQLGSSSGSNIDYDANSGQLTDCCGGTLGALLQDSGGNQYVLSNDHVFARSDQAIPGETIIQPGLIDNGCTPYGVGPGTNPVATLTGYPSLSSPLTNVDAAIAHVTPGLVDSKGNILELGAKQPDGMLAAAPPGISSSGGRGESASLGMMVAKSGRTTGLTCAAVSAIDVDVVVDYFTDCAETAHAMSKTFTNQIAIAGTSFSDAGDSGALVVDSANAEPVGLFFAGGTDTNGVEHAIASPVADVLSTLDSQVSGVGGQTTYSFVGGADHPVSCLSYDTAKPAVDPSVAVRTLSAAERERMEAALPQAQLLLNPASGITRIGLAASKDRPGAGAIAFYAEPAAYAQAAIPPAIGGVPTVVIAASAPQSTAQPEPSTLPVSPRAASLALAIAAKQHNAASLMKANPAIFGVGVGQSLDDPSDAAVILYVDRRQSPGNLPEALDGQRVRVLLMDRLHVTRAHGSGSAARSAVGCSARRTRLDSSSPLLFDERLQLPE